VIGNPAIFIHHVLGLVCMPMGLYVNMYGIFGLVAIVFMEGTNPSMNLIWQLRTLGLEQTRLNLVNGVVFVVLYFTFRVVVCDYFLYVLIAALYKLEGAWPWWAWMGVVVYGGFCTLNWFWFYKVILMFKRRLGRYLSAKKE
jgi:hypothetical protein